ncbi:uncharacterized protein LOC123010928 [Tribolium madens]|uniref:uncharacterized protein LOC123010928 n=1 Tax=Tribolium madens TaxID=41895 RepID=UPI001CF72EDA|nr:uncharacterized protein LOC123010928 [Tribolium madens]
MATLRYVFVCFCWWSLVNSDVLHENSSESHSSEISAVLNHLNASPFKVYNYNKATLLSAQTKADIIELILDINVDCINKYPNVPCSEKIVTCHAFVRNTPEEGSKVLTDVNCKPKPEIIIDEVYDSPINLTDVNTDEPKPIMLSNEAVSSEVGEHFVAVKKDSVPCLGCPFDLSTNAEGVDELIDVALEHIETERPKKQALVKVLRLQQQVVTGVKYILTAEFASTICVKGVTDDLSLCPRDTEIGTTICEITYLHKPWISKAKHVIKNNCTISQEYVKADTRKSDISNEIDVTGKRTKLIDTPNFDKMAENGAIDEMTPSRLADLESQIIADVKSEIIVPSTVESHPQVESKLEFDLFQTPESLTVYEAPAFTTSVTMEEPTPTEEEASRLKRDEGIKQDSSSESVEMSAKQSQATSSSEENSSEEVLRPRRAIRQLEKISPDEKGLVKNLADFAANALDNIDDDNNKRIILQILGAKKMVGDDGIYYHIIMRMGISRCLEDSPINPYENCKDKLFENYTKICKVQVYVNDDFGSKKVVKSQCQNIKRDKNDNNRTNYSRYKRDVLVGAPNRIDKNNEKIQQYVKEGINGFNANYNNNNNKVKPVEVISATTQVVAGTLYKITVKISESDCSKNDNKDLDECNILEGASPKTCELEVWDKPWENFRQFTIKCEGDEQKIKFQTNPKNRAKRQAPGGQIPVTKDNEYVVKYLEAALSQLDANSPHENKFKVHEFLSATSQTVSGHIYRIKTKVVLSDCKKSVSTERSQCGTLQDAKPKTCKFEVFEQTWVPNSRRIKTDCDKERTKRQDLDGGIYDVDKDNDEVKKFVREGLLNLNTHLTTNNKVKPVEVVSATGQVVAGIVHRIKVKISESDCSRNDQKDFEQCNVLEGASPKLCEMEVWDKPWEGFRRYTIKCEGENKQHQFVLNPNRRSKRHTLGGELPVTKDDEFVVKYLEAALNQLDAESEHENKFKVHEFISATSQTVSGHIYRIKAKVILSDCKKTISSERDHCSTLKDAKPKTCKFEVFEQLWVPNSRKIKTDCDSKRVKRQRSESVFNAHTRRSKRQSIPGGATEIDKRSDKVKQYVQESLTHLNTQLTSSNKVKPVEVLSATSQVVAGTIHRIKIKISESDCSKDDEKDFNECNIREGASPKICEVKVWDKPWQNFRQYNITCEGEDHHYTFETKPGKAKRDADFDNLLGRDDRKYHLSLFTDFLTKYNKKYHKKEYKYRFNVFVQNLMQIRVLNTFEQGTATYGITKFADMTQKEFSRSLGLRMDLRNENEAPFAQAKIPDVELPTEFDWRKKGVVTEVKNQEQCGSCWAFSVTGNLEGQYALKHGKLLEFSEQELVDCDTDDQGCNGGLMDTAYRSIEKIGGLETEQDYPYDAEDEKCHFNRTLARVQVTSALNISHNETDMAKWLVANGPISIAINANAMQFYMGGVSHPFKFLCNPKNLDHGVLIVGYGVHNYPLFKKSLPYWIVKNSWGTGWGEQGYYRVYRGDGTCGLNQTPSSAIVA